MDGLSPMLLNQELTRPVDPYQVEDAVRSIENDSSEEAGRKFEALLATFMVREMRKTLPNGFFGGGPGADVYGGWMDQHMAQVLADQNALGLAGQIKVSMERITAMREKAAEKPEGVE